MKVNSMNDVPTSSSEPSNLSTNMAPVVTTSRHMIQKVRLNKDSKTVDSPISVSDWRSSVQVISHRPEHQDGQATCVPTLLVPDSCQLEEHRLSTLLYARLEVIRPRMLLLERSAGLSARSLPHVTFKTKFGLVSRWSPNATRSHQHTP